MYHRKPLCVKFKGKSIVLIPSYCLVVMQHILVVSAAA